MSKVLGNPVYAGADCAAPAPLMPLEQRLRNIMDQANSIRVEVANIQTRLFGPRPDNGNKAVEPVCVADMLNHIQTQLSQAFDTVMTINTGI